MIYQKSFEHKPIGRRVWTQFNSKVTDEIDLIIRRVSSFVITSAIFITFKWNKFHSIALKLLHLKSCGPQSIRLRFWPETLQKRVNSINFKKDNWLDCAAKQSNRHKLAPNLSAGCRVSRQHKPNKKGNKFLNDPQRSGYHSARHGRQNPTVSCRINFGLRLSLATCILLVARQCGSSNQPPDIYSRNDKCSGGRMTRTALHTSRYCRKCHLFLN